MVARPERLQIRVSTKYSNLNVSTAFYCNVEATVSQITNPTKCTRAGRSHFLFIYFLNKSLQQKIGFLSLAFQANQIIHGTLGSCILGSSSLPNFLLGGGGRTFKQFHIRYQDPKLDYRVVLGCFVCCFFLKCP